MLEKIYSESYSSTSHAIKGARQYLIAHYLQCDCGMHCTFTSDSYISDIFPSDQTFIYS